MANPVNKWGLTPRQEQILALMAERGLTSKEVGFELGISFKTVEVHVARFIERTGARTRTQAILMYDRAIREQQANELREEALRKQAELQLHFSHCPTCGGAGFVRKVA